MRRMLIAGWIVFAFPALAQQAKLGDIRVEAAFARATPAGAQIGTAFMTLVNGGKQADRLVAVKTDAAAKAEMHTHVMDGGVARMREVPGIEISAGGTTELKPGGYHLMLLGLKRPLKEGTSVPIELRFERAGSVVVDVPVKALGAAAHKGH